MCLTVCENWCWLYLQMADNAVGFSPPQATGGWSFQVHLSTNQEVTGCRVTASMGTAVGKIRLLCAGRWQDFQGNKYKQNRHGDQNMIVFVMLFK